MKNLIIHIQPVIKFHPGHAGIGIVICAEDGTTLNEHGEYIGEKTNFQAYYMAAIKALELAEIYLPEKVELHTNNLIVVNQLNKTSMVNKPELKKLYYQVVKSPLYERCSFRFTKGKHKIANMIAKQALEEALIGLERKI